MIANATTLVEPLNPLGLYSTSCALCGKQHRCVRNGDQWVVDPEVNCESAGTKPENFWNHTDLG